MTNKLEEFSKELLLLRKDAEKNISIEDYKHLRKVIILNRIFLFLGISTAWLIPNPFSMICISLAKHNQWTIVAHHVLHGGYDKISNIPKRYTSNHFASGWRRVIDWFDWIYPPAWKYEHNTLHHFYTNERLDPDMVSYKLDDPLDRQHPKWYRLLVVFYFMCTWKATYYSKNTLKAYHEKKNYNHNGDIAQYSGQSYLYNFIPYIGLSFIIFPLLYLPLAFFFSLAGWKIFLFVLINFLGAEILTNIHSFCTIVPSHIGEDISLQPSHFKTKEEFFVNQINNTCNFNTGGFLRDYLHGYMNYQIEHHLFPHLPVFQYVKLQPKVKMLCERYGIQYKQEFVLKRVKMVVSIFTYSNTMEVRGKESEYV